RYEGFLRAHRRTDPERIDEATVAAYVTHLEGLVDEDGRRMLRPASVARAVAAVRSFPRFWNRGGRTASDPRDEICAPAVAAGIPKALSEPEIEALLGAVTGTDALAQRDRALLELLYGTGIRIGEAVALDLADLDLDGSLARVFGKGSKERVVPLGRAALV